jgi:hypothetical protein
MPEERFVADPCAEAVIAILEANGVGERANLQVKHIEERASDAGGNRLLLAEVGNRHYFIVLSPALKGRLVGTDDGIQDEEVRAHFNVNLIGKPAHAG